MDAESRFSTAGVPAADRVRRWEAWNAGALLALAAHPVPGTTLAAAQVARRLPGARVARVRASAHTVARRPADVAATPTGAVAVFVPLGPAGRFASDGTTTALAAGRVLVCDADRPFAREFPSGVDELVVTAPRPAGVVLDAPRWFDLDRAAPAAVVALARDLHAGAERAWRLAPLVTAVLEGRPAADRLTLARAYVAQHLGDPALSATTIAAALEISERQVSRTFAAAGTTVPGEVLEQRLQWARVLLEREPGVSPATVARRVGIASASHFTKRFTARFGVTPGRWPTAG